MNDRRARNPVLPGHHPDPSLCRVGDDFYLVTSSFTYFPAIPVFHSRDLVHWRQIGSVIDRPDLVPLPGLESSDGIWAPTIRFHQGVFFVTCTVAAGRRGWINFVTTATDPAGGWSDPVALDAEGIDPSLFFDEDGRAWYCAARDAADERERAELWIQEFDPVSLSLTGPQHVIWHGAMRGEWTEAPHIHKRNGTYWLIAAAGGTERNHAVVAASSSHVLGPYHSDPRNPLLTHRALDSAYPVQNVGHADLVDLADGTTWAVLLATRPIAGTHTLGRETFLTEVAWSDDGPVFSPGSGRLELEFDAPLPLDPPTDSLPSRETFRDGVPLGWVSLRAPLQIGDPEDVDGLSLQPSPDRLSDTGIPAFLARPQQHVIFRAEAAVDLREAGPSDRGALVVFQNQGRFAELETTVTEGGAEVVLRGFDGQERELGRAVMQTRRASAIHLRVSGDVEQYTFSAAADGGSWVQVGPTIPRSWFSTEEAGGFVGVHLGLHARGTEPWAGGVVRFAWFEYKGQADASSERAGEIVHDRGHTI